MRVPRRRFGFAMIELLVVLVIAMVLYTVALGPVRSYLDGKKRGECAENLRKLHLVLTLYANDHGGAFPKPPMPATSDDAFAMLVPKCTSDPSIFHCAAAEKKSCYSYVSGLTKDQLAPLAADGAAFHQSSSGNVLYTDGHVETFSPGGQRLPALPVNATLLEPRP
jgi:prepilin-type processing-associated H-X9-DG protein